MNDDNIQPWLIRATTVGELPSKHSALREHPDVLKGAKVDTAVKRTTLIAETKSTGMMVLIHAIAAGTS